MPEIENEKMRGLLIAAAIAAIKAGGAILDVYRSAFSVEQKADGSPLTLADRTAHEIISDHILNLKDFSVPLLSEEGRDIPYKERTTWDYYWLVDPLDGTKEFVSRNGEFTVNIALVQKDRPVMGVVLVPTKDVLYFAAEGIGSFRLTAASKTADVTSFKDLKAAAERLPLPETGDRIFTVIASRSHLSEETETFIDGLNKEHGEIRLLSAGSSKKFCLIAEGSADIYPRFGPTMEWDTAAGQAIVEQAGGSVLQYGTGEPLKYNKENLLNPWFIVRG